MKHSASFTCSALNSASLRLALFVLGGISLALLPVNAQEKFSLKIKNDSKYDIHRLYVASSEDEKWGPDQLRDDTIPSGGTFTLTDLAPGEYDIKFVDEDGDECVLKRIGIFKNLAWSLTTEWLEKCEGYSGQSANVPDLTGNWVGYFSNGSRSDFVWAIRQNGSTLSIENVGKGPKYRSSGRVEGNKVFAQDFATKNGTLSADRTRITWTDGIVWVRQ